jgi:hypothetical protein
MESCIAPKKPKPSAPKATANAEASESWQLFLIFAVAATLAAPVAIVVGSTASFFCIFVFISIFSFINRTKYFAKLLEQEWIIKRKQFFAELLEKEWIKHIYFSFTIDPDSIEQQVTSIRLVRHFRANNVAAN